MISGTTTGVTADLPEIATFNPQNISTTTALAGGNISSDGGAAVTARGWFGILLVNQQHQIAKPRMGQAPGHLKVT